MDLLSLRDLPLALAFGIVCLWFLNQNNIEHGKKFIALVAEFEKAHSVVTKNYETLFSLILEERKQWLIDQRAEKAILIEKLDSNTAAMTKEASEIHQLRSTLTPLVLLVERLAKQEQTGVRRRSTDAKD